MLMLLLTSLPLAANELLQSHSPYLKMHGNDPVNWHLIDKKLLKQAQQQNKLIYISSGYFSCHWCHVMQKESYQNREIANFLNRHFIAVKLDREVTPALDHYLIEFVTATRGSAGWPLNVFITPQGYPLLGLSYLPPDKFLQLLQDLQQQWQKNAPRLQQLAFEANAELNQQNLMPPLSRNQQINRFLKSSNRLIDDFNGGFGEQSKFPMVPQMLLLLELVPNLDSRLKDFIPLTLDKMRHSGLHDPVNGGFFRYTIDAEWETPHFEKMLYDNAQLAKLYLLADKHYPGQGYAQTAYETLDFVLRHMQHPNGGYLSSWTADDEQQTEGGYYLWTSQQLQKLLNSQQYQLIQKFWQWNSLPESGEQWLYPLQTQSIQAFAQKNHLEARTLARQINTIKQTLAKYQQQKRNNPKDSKRVASWNALLLESLALAGQKQPRFAHAAQTLADWMQKHLFKQQQFYRDPFHNKRATLEDYAYFVKALLVLENISPKTAQLVEPLLQQGWQKFYLDQQWHDSEDTYLPGQSGYYQQQDRAIPSGAAVFLLANKIWLGRHSKPQWKQRLQTLAKIQTESYQKNIFNHASSLYWRVFDPQYKNATTRSINHSNIEKQPTLARY